MSLLMDVNRTVDAEDLFFDTTDPQRCQACGTLLLPGQSRWECAGCCGDYPNGADDCDEYDDDDYCDEYDDDYCSECGAYYSDGDCTC